MCLAFCDSHHDGHGSVSGDGWVCGLQWHFKIDSRGLILTVTISYVYRLQYMITMVHGCPRI
jgi:hypothetical protein